LDAVRCLKGRRGEEEAYVYISDRDFINFDEGEKENLGASFCLL